MADEPFPPWVADPDAQSMAHPVPSDYAYAHATWRRFWDALDGAERAACLLRHPPGARWMEYLEWVALDQEVARIDAEDIASGVLQPNGSPWPAPEVVRPSPWRRLLGWRRTA